MAARQGRKPEAAQSRAEYAGLACSPCPEGAHGWTKPECEHGYFPELLNVSGAIGVEARFPDH